jgi:hypothetical protein
MLRLGFEPTIPAFERAKAVLALDRAAGHCDRIISVIALVNHKQRHEHEWEKLHSFKTKRGMNILWKPKWGRHIKKLWKGALI